jgi:hypothetical protein
VAVCATIREDSNLGGSDGYAPCRWLACRSERAREEGGAYPNRMFPVPGNQGPCGCNEASPPSTTQPTCGRPQPKTKRTSTRELTCKLNFSPCGMESILTVNWLSMGCPKPSAGGGRARTGSVPEIMGAGGRWVLYLISDAGWKSALRCGCDLNVETLGSFGSRNQRSWSTHVRIPRVLALREDAPRVGLTRRQVEGLLFQSALEKSQGRGIALSDGRARC